MALVKPGQLSGYCNGCGDRTTMSAIGKGKHVWACRKCQIEAGILKASKGHHDKDINHPQEFLVGEAGPERVDITPLRKKNHVGFHNHPGVGDFWKP